MNTSKGSLNGHIIEERRTMGSRGQQEVPSVQDIVGRRQQLSDDTIHNSAPPVRAGHVNLGASAEPTNNFATQSSFTLTCATGLPDLHAPSLPSRPTAAYIIRTKTCRLSCMLVLTFGFFLVEIIFGYVTNSLALVSDSYHMLSDVLALCIGIASVRISKLNSRKNTYGWARAEVLGALVNAVFLIALCFTIFVEAIQRLTTDDKIEHVEWLLYVGIAGLVINLIGLVLFQGTHGHTHGGHGHGHGHQGHSHAEVAESDVNVVEIDVNGTSLDDVRVEDQPQQLDSIESSESDVNNSGEMSTNNAADGNLHKGKKKKIKSAAQLNMRGVFLHVLGDALGSVVVIVSAIVIKFTDVEWKYKIDPAMSMVLVIIILSTTIPLLKESALILMQTVPTHIQVSELKKKLINSIDGVLAVHEFHVWQLAGNRIVASAHIRCISQQDYMRIAEQIKSFFHNEGIHSTTIQPEFVECEETSSDRDCVLECGPDKSCYTDTCCARKKIEQASTALHRANGDSPSGLRQRTNCSTQPPTSDVIAVDASDGCTQQSENNMQSRNDDSNYVFVSQF